MKAGSAPGYLILNAEFLSFSSASVSCILKDPTLFGYQEEFADT